MVAAIRRDETGVTASTRGGRLGVGTGHDKLGVGTDAELDGGSRRQGGLGVMMDGGLIGASNAPGLGRQHAVGSGWH